MFKKTSKFIKKLQNSDEQVKRRWLWILSGGTIVIVVILWGFYINNSIMSLGPVSSLKDSVISSDNGPKESNASVSKFGAVFRNFFSVLRNEFKIAVSRLKSELGQATLSRVFTIRNIRQDFTLDSLPAVPHQKLP